MCLSQAAWKGMMLNMHKNSKIWYWLFFSLFLWFCTFGAFFILCFKGKQVPFCISFALVFGGVRFAVAELFSLTTLYSEMIFRRAPSVTRL